MSNTKEITANIEILLTKECKLTKGKHYAKTLLGNYNFAFAQLYAGNAQQISAFLDVFHMCARTEASQQKILSDDERNAFHELCNAHVGTLQSICRKYGPDHPTAIVGAARAGAAAVAARAQEFCDVIAQTCEFANYATSHKNDGTAFQTVVTSARFSCKAAEALETETIAFLQLIDDAVNVDRAALQDARSALDSANRANIKMSVAIKALDTAIDGKALKINTLMLEKARQAANSISSHARAALKYTDKMVEWRYVAENYETQQWRTSPAKTAALAAIKLRLPAEAWQDCYATGTGAAVRMLVGIREALLGYRPSSVRSRLELLHPMTVKALCDHAGTFVCRNGENISLSSLGITAQEWIACKDEATENQSGEGVNCTFVKAIRKCVLTKSNTRTVWKQLHVKGARPENDKFLKALRYIGGRATNALIDEFLFAHKTQTGLTCLFHPECQLKTASVNQNLWASFSEHVCAAHWADGPLSLAFALDNKQMVDDNTPVMKTPPIDRLIYQWKVLDPSEDFFCPVCFKGLASGDLKDHVAQHASGWQGSLKTDFDVHELLRWLHLRESCMKSSPTSTGLHLLPYVQLYRPVDRLDQRVEFMKWSELRQACFVCGAGCIDMIRHLREHHPEAFPNHDQCSSCCKWCPCHPPFASYQDHRNHFIDAHFVPDNFLTCSICETLFEDEKSFKHHLKQTESRLMQCPIKMCNTVFDVVDDLAKHLRIKHSNVGSQYDAKSLRLLGHMRGVYDFMLPDPIVSLGNTCFKGISPPQIRRYGGTRAGQNNEEAVAPPIFSNHVVSVKVSKLQATEVYDFVGATVAFWKRYQGVMTLLQGNPLARNGTFGMTNEDGDATISILNSTFSLQATTVVLAVLDTPVATLSLDNDVFSLVDILHTNDTWSSKQFTSKVTRGTSVENHWIVTICVTYLPLSQPPIVTNPNLPSIKVAIIDTPVQKNHPALRNHTVHSLNPQNLQSSTSSQIEKEKLEIICKNFQTLVQKWKDKDEKLNTSLDAIAMDLKEQVMIPQIQSNKDLNDLKERCIGRLDTFISVLIQHLRVPPAKDIKMQVRNAGKDLHDARAEICKDTYCEVNQVLWDERLTSDAQQILACFNAAIVKVLFVTGLRELVDCSKVIRSIGDHGTNVAGLVVVGVNASSAEVSRREIEIRGYDATFASWNWKWTGPEISRNISPYLLLRQVTNAVEDGCAIFNMSLGSLAEHPATKEAVAYAHSKHRLVVASVGNDGNGAALYFPAQNRSVVAVASLGTRSPNTDQRDMLSTDPISIATSSCLQHPKFTDRASKRKFPDLMIFANGMQSCSLLSNSKFGLLEGSSMATALVSGLLAKILSLGQQNFHDGSFNIDYKAMYDEMSANLQKYVRDVKLNVKANSSQPVLVTVGAVSFVLSQRKKKQTPQDA